MKSWYSFEVVTGSEGDSVDCNAKDASRIPVLKEEILSMPTRNERDKKSITGRSRRHIQQIIDVRGRVEPIGRVDGEQTYLQECSGKGTNIPRIQLHVQLSFCRVTTPLPPHAAYMRPAPDIVAYILETDDEKGNGGGVLRRREIYAGMLKPVCTNKDLSTVLPMLIRRSSYS